MLTGDYADREFGRCTYLISSQLRGSASAGVHQFWGRVPHRSIITCARRTCAPAYLLSQLKVFTVALVLPRAWPLRMRNSRMGRPLLREQHCTCLCICLRRQRPVRNLKVFVK